MKFYHGGASEPMLNKIGDIAPSFIHGNGWTPGENGKCFDRIDRNYFLDNGAFTSSFDEEEWLKALDKMFDFKSSPDFVVLPDVFDDREKTWERHRKYVSEVEKRGFDHYFVAQPPEDRTKGAEASEVVEKAVQLGSSGIFIGGSWEKSLIVSDFLEKARKQNLKVHIGKPGDLVWACRSGVDSMDTTSIVRNQNWKRLRRVEMAYRQQRNVNEWIKT